MKNVNKYLAIGFSALLLAGCANAASEESHDHDHHDVAHTEGAKEVSNLERRAVLATEGGNLVTLNLTTGEVVKETKLDGFLRVNDAGDSRHVLVTNGDKFQVFDTGLDAQKHDDHYHYFESEPTLTDISYKAPKAGHVVVHDGKTALFADGDGSVTVIPTDDIAKKDAKTTRFETGAGHHGVAVPLKNDELFVTKGTEEERHTIQVRKGDEVLAETTDCPGSHGETTAKPNESGEVVVMGCTNGPVIYKDGAFHKVPVADEYSRSGNLAGTDTSPIVLGDYKVDKEADLERPTRVALIDTVSGTLSTVELGSSYWFRSLGRGPADEALVLTYDGNLNVIDQNTGEVTNKVPVIGEWQEKDDWQAAGPVFKVVGDWGYITDAVNKELVVVDLTSYEVTKRFKLDKPVVEMAVTTGKKQ